MTSSATAAGFVFFFLTSPTSGSFWEVIQQNWFQEEQGWKVWRERGGGEAEGGEREGEKQRKHGWRFKKLQPRVSVGRCCAAAAAQTLSLIHQFNRLSRTVYSVRLGPDCRIRKTTFTHLNLAASLSASLQCLVWLLSPWSLQPRFLSKDAVSLFCQRDSQLFQVKPHQLLLITLVWMW